jgi:predicted house-cleaning NTP pyrophosphatase (Maf/HAM1 superfamily)
VRALRLAHAKAAAVADRHPGAWVIGSDQVAVCGERILDKPGEAARCREQLAASSGGGSNSTRRPCSAAPNRMPSPSMWTSRSSISAR